MTTSLTITLIVRNDEQTLGRCLESVRGLADEIVVVDTGSTDFWTQSRLRYGNRGNWVLMSPMASRIKTRSGRSNRRWFRCRLFAD
jgi:Glycosyl transferase family 2